MRLRIIQHGQAVHVKRKATLFGCTVCPCRMAGSVAGILGYLIKLQCYFFMAVSIRTARLLLLYALAKKLSVFYFHGCFYRGSKCSIAICLSQRIVHLICMAVSIRTASAIAICFSQKIVHLIFIAVSIRTARLLLLYALANKT